MKKLLLILSLALSTTAFSQVPSYVPTSGLQGWWPFNGNANDESVNSYDGTVNGATLTTDRFGIANAAYSFNGIANSILVPSVFYDISVSHSISMWVSINDLTLVGQYLWNTSNHTGEAFVYNWGAYNNNVMYCLGNGTSWSITCGTEQTFLTTTSNIWYLYTMTYSSGVWSIFINGQLADTYTSANLPMGVSSLVFGDIASGGEALNGKLDDIGIWNRALDSCEIKDLYFASLGNCCNVSVTTQPINQSVNISNNAQFTTASSDPLAIYQWQTDLGVCFLNLNSVGQYSGTTNVTLTVANTTLSNNNQPFRCIVSSGACTDTSAVAVLTVVNNVGINEVSQSNIFTVYPNPTNSTLTINTKANYTSIQIVNTIGQVVFTKEKSASLNVSSLPSGIYFIQLLDNKGSVISNEKFVKE